MLKKITYEVESASRTISNLRWVLPIRKKNQIEALLHMSWFIKPKLVGYISPTNSSFLEKPVLGFNENRTNLILKGRATEDDKLIKVIILPSIGSILGLISSIIFFLFFLHHYQNEIGNLAFLIPFTMAIIVLVRLIIDILKVEKICDRIIEKADLEYIKIGADE